MCARILQLLDSAHPDFMKMRLIDGLYVTRYFVPLTYERQKTVLTSSIEQIMKRFYKQK